MRFDLLKKDTLYFQEHFPTENFDMFANKSKYQSPEFLEEYLEKGWRKDSNVKLNFFEALCYLRYEDFFEYKGFRSYSLNEIDTEYTYDSVCFQEWVLDEQGYFDIMRYASGIYNLPIRVIAELDDMSADKNRQCEYVLNYIEDILRANNE